MEVIKRVLFTTLVAQIVVCINQNSANVSKPKEDQLKYVFTIPKKLQTAQNETACFLALNHKGPITLEVFFYWENQTLASTKRKTQGGTQDCFAVKVPAIDDLLKGQQSYVTLEVGIEAHYGRDQQKFLKYRQNVAVFRNPPSLMFLEIDKALYKPGDVVRIRVLILDSNLKMVSTNSSTIIPQVKILDKNGYTVAIWENVTTELGLAQLEHNLPEDSEEEKWKIEMGPIRKTFEIKKSVLPRFQLSTRYPKEVYSKAKRLKVKICAKYTYGISVRGNAYITVKAQGYFEKSKYTMNDVRELQNGCTVFTISRDKIPLDSTIARLKIETSIVEFGSGHMESANLVIPITEVPYRVTLTSGPKPVPGLLYRGVLRVWKNYVEVKNISFDVCYRENGINMTYCKPVKVEKDRTVPFHFIVGNETKEVVLLIENGETWETQSKDGDGNRKTLSLRSSTSRSYVYLEKYGKSKLQCTDKDVRIVVHFTTDNFKLGEKVTFYYMVMSNDRILKANKITRTIMTKEPKKVDYKTVKNFIKTEAGFEPEPTSPEEKFILKINLNKIKIMGKMQVIVYYVRKTQEIVSDVILLDGNKCVENRVQVKWSDMQKNPGDSVTMRLNASANSICAITSVDKALTIQTPHPVYLTERVFAGNLFKPKETPPTIAKILCIQDEEAMGIVGERGQNLTESHPDINGPESHENEISCDIVIDRRKRDTTDGTNNFYQTRKIFQEFGAALVTNIGDIRQQFCAPKHVKQAESRKCNFLQNFDAVEEGSEQIRRVFAQEDMVPLSLVPEIIVTEPDDPHNYRFGDGNNVIVAETDGNAGDTGYYDEVDVTVTTRTEFPETWIWDLVSIGNSGKVDLSKKLPHSITKWHTNVYCVSPTEGVQVSKETEIGTFQPFFLEILSPYSIKRGEVLHLQVLLFNYLNHSVPVRVTIYETDGIEIVGQVKERSEISCIEKGDHITEIFKVQARSLGQVEIEVSAEIEGSYPRECGPDFAIYRKDTIRKNIVVDSEGYPAKKYKTDTLCTESFRNVSNVTWYLQPPLDILPDTAKAKVVLNMNVLGPTITNLDNLFEVPTGCGEQVMAKMALNLYALDYLNATKRSQEKSFRKAMKNLKTGYQRMMKFKHRDGSFSAFGEKTDMYGSTFLTTFVLRTLQKARTYIYVDQRLLEEAFRWTLRLQMENGCFFDTSHNFQFMGEMVHDGDDQQQQYSVETPSLAAYVMISLLEANATAVPENVRQNVRFCLKTKTAHPDPYTVAITTYALFKLGETGEAENSVRKLMQMGHHEEGDTLYWQGPTLASSVEITGYAILSLLYHNTLDNLAYVNAAVRWLNAQRRHEGGFVSTQDTVVALDALTRYGQILQKDQVDLTVRVNATNLREVYQLKKSDAFETRQVKLPVLPSSVSVQLEGVGCIIVQTVLEYNTRLAEEYVSELRSTPEELTVDAEVNVNSHKQTDKCQATLTPCITYRGNNRQTSMAILEIYIPTGFEVDKESLEDMLPQKQTYDISSPFQRHSNNVKYYEFSHNKITLYLEYLTRDETVCKYVIFTETAKVEYRKNANIHAYDYYNPTLSTWTSFHFPACSKQYTTEQCDNITTTIVYENTTDLVDGDENMWESTTETTEEDIPID